MLSTNKEILSHRGEFSFSGP